MPSLGFGIGLIWAVTNASWIINTGLQKSEMFRPINITGYVASIPKQSNRNISFQFVTSIINNKPNKQRILLRWYGHPPQKIKPGQVWSLLVKLKPAHSFANPGSFDYARWLLTQNIHLLGSVKQSRENKLIKPSHNDYLDQLRLSWINQLKFFEYLPKMGLIKALTLGYRSDVTYDQWQVFKKTGTIHLMAISGLHVGLVALFSFQFCMLVFRNFSWLLLYIPLQRLSLIFSLFVVWCYGLISGMAIPTERALIMISVLAMTQLLYLRVDLAERLAIAAFVVLLIHPLSVLSASFWLSFCAAGLLCYGMKYTSEVSPYWKQALDAQKITTIGFFPLTLFFFHQVSLVSVVANLISVPWMSFVVMPLSLIGLVSSKLSTDIASMVFYLANESLELLWLILAPLANFKFSIWQEQTPSFWKLIFAMIGVAILLSPKKLKFKYLGVIGLLPLFVLSKSSLSHGEFELDVLDVGQGLATIVQTKKHVLVFDTGPKFGPNFDMGSAVVAPFLRDSGNSKIDIMIVSHGDNDHIGGADYLLNDFKVNKVLTSVPWKIKNHKSLHCMAGQHWNWDGVNFKVLYPYTMHYEGNNSSCVLKVGNDGKSVLLTGDIEKPAEKTLAIKYGPALKSSVIVAPHHGSRTSSSQKFLDFVKPKYVVYSTGFHNRFRFPSKVVVRRYRQINAEAENTASSGMVKFTFLKGIFNKTLYRESHKQFWD